nr:MAG TPA: hypothetical protein [Caudoviricetes sp.]
MMFALESTKAISLSSQSDAVHVQHGGLIHKLYLGGVGHVGGVVANVGDVGGTHHAGQGHQFVCLDKAAVVDVHHHAVITGSACALDPAGGCDDQIYAVVCGHVVLLEKIVDGLSAQIAHHRGGDIAVLFVGDEDVVGDACLIVFIGSPYGSDGAVDIRQDLLGSLGCPIGGGAGARSSSGGLGDIGVVDKAGGGVLVKADVCVLIHVLVVGQADAVLQHLIQAAADEVCALHIHEHHAQGSGKDMRLERALAHAGLYNGDAVGAAAVDSRSARAACHAVCHGHGRNVIDPAAAHFDGDITGIGDTGKRLADQRVTLFQFAGEECVAALDGSRVHGGCAAGQCTGVVYGESTGIGGADILKVCHSLALLSGVCTVEDDQFGHAVGISCAAPLAVSEFDGVPGGLVVRCRLKAADKRGSVVSGLGNADVNVTAQSRGTALAQHVDAAALEHAAGLAGGVFAAVLVRIDQGALDLAARNARELCSSSAGATHHDDLAVVILQGSAKRNAFGAANGAGVDDHIRLTGISASKAVGHGLADNLSIQGHNLALLLHVGIAVVVSGLGSLARLLIPVFTGCASGSGGAVLCSFGNGFHGAAALDLLDQCLGQGITGGFVLNAVDNGAHGFEQSQTAVVCSRLCVLVLRGHGGGTAAVLVLCLFLLVRLFAGHFRNHLVQIVRLFVLCRFGVGGEQLIQLAGNAVHCVQNSGVLGVGGRCILSGVCIRRRCGGCCIQRSGGSLHHAVQLFGGGVLGRETKQLQQALAFAHVFYLAFLRRKFGGIVFYCNIMTGAPSWHDGDVVAADVGLAVSGSAGGVVAEIPAGYLPQDAVTHF